MRSRRKLTNSLGRDYESLSQVVYRTLREQILWGAIPPGSRLSVRELAERLGVSAMPVRDALHKLATEELVEVRPRAATHVASISMDRIMEMFQVRTHLEALAGRLAADRLAPSDIQRLKRYQQQMERAGVRGRAEEWHKWNQEFHQLIFRKCGNALLQRMTQSLWDTNFRLFTARVVTQASFRNRRSAEHRKILDALERGDADAAEATYRYHMMRSGDETVAFLRTLAPDTGAVRGRKEADSRNQASINGKGRRGSPGRLPAKRRDAIYADHRTQN